MQIAIVMLVLSLNPKQQTEILSQGRLLFYQSLDQESKIEPAEALFEQIAGSAEYGARAKTYLGALTAIRGKHSFWPHKKFILAKQGLAMMDRGLEENPDDIEALFIRGSTCYYLPFFFGRQNDAQRDFKHILEQLPGQWRRYDRDLVVNVIEFILENGDLSADERERARRLLDTVSEK